MCVRVKVLLRFSVLHVCVCSMGPDTAWMVMAAHGCRQALGGAGPLLVGIKAGGIWLQRSSKNSK